MDNQAPKRSVCYMDSVRKPMEALLRTYSIKRQQKILNLVSQNCPVVEMGQNRVIIENAHIHPYGINYSPVHQHHFLEIHVPYDGAGFVDSEGKKHPFRLGEFVLNPPEQIHYWKMTRGPLNMLILWISMEDQPENPEPQDRLLIEFFSAKKLVHRLPNSFIPLYRALLAEAASPRIGLEISLRDYLSQLILSLARATVPSRKLEQKIQIEPQGRDERLVFLVDRFLRLNLTNELRLEDIARQVSLSPRSLTRKYREIRDRSIGEELNHQRMVHAEELLRETDLPIKAIAAECGILDQCYFARKFKNIYHQTPSNYRRQLIPT